jgi:hypothetical protein
MTPDGELRPLPVRPRPQPGDTTDAYVERLARANHLPAGYLRLCLAPRKGAAQPVLSRLAAVSGRTEAALRNALTDLTCAHCGTPLPPRRSHRTARWCSPLCNSRATRRRERGLPERRDIAAPAPRTTCQECGADLNPAVRPGNPRIYCSDRCKVRAYRRRKDQREREGT